MNRAPWSPSNAKDVVLACGHLTLGWSQVKAIGTAFPGAEAYCEECGEWIRVMRDATCYETAGIQVPLPHNLTEPPY